MHFTLSDARAHRWIAAQTSLPEVARATLVETDPRIHVQMLPRGFVAVLGDLHHDFSGDPENFGVLHVYVDDVRMISARLHPLKSTDLLRRELLSAGRDVRSPMALFERFVVCLAQNFADVVADLAEEADDAEERILAGRYQDHATKLGRMRRLLARLRRHLNGNRAVMGTIAARLPDSYPAEERQRLRQAAERLDAAAQDLELVQERARLLQEEIAGRVGEATNRNLFLLSIMTTSLLPITVITGAFGMNVPGIPWGNHAAGFWWVIGVLLLAVVVTLLMLRWRRIL